MSRHSIFQQASKKESELDFFQPVLDLSSKVLTKLDNIDAKFGGCLDSTGKVRPEEEVQEVVNLLINLKTMLVEARQASENYFREQMDALKADLANIKI